MKENQKILIYGYGNPGRQDDGLGYEFTVKFKEWCDEQEISNIDFDNNYQLNIEEAEILTNYDTVIFVDASIEEDVDQFEFTVVDEINELSFTTHAASPSYIYMLGKKLFGSVADTFLLHIKGYEFEFLGEISDHARKNLDLALDFLKDRILDKELLKESAVVNQRSTLS